MSSDCLKIVDLQRQNFCSIRSKFKWNCILLSKPMSPLGQILKQSFWPLVFRAKLVNIEKYSYHSVYSMIPRILPCNVKSLEDLMKNGWFHGTLALSRLLRLNTAGAQKINGPSFKSENLFFWFIYLLFFLFFYRLTL